MKCETCGNYKYEMFLMWDGTLYYFCSLECIQKFINEEAEKEKKCQ